MTTWTGRRAAVASVALIALATGALPAAARDDAPSQPDAVQRWNNTAGRVALASCISPGNDPLPRVPDVRPELIGRARRPQRDRPSLRVLCPARSAGPRGVCAAAVAAASRTSLTEAVRGLPETFADCRPAALGVIEQAYAGDLAHVPAGWAKDRGVSVGIAAARAVIRTRVGDGSDTPLMVPDHPQGAGTRGMALPPDRAFAFAPEWAEVRPFALKGPAGFRIEPPYRLGSAAYASDFAEVKALGGDGVGTPSARTPDQTEAARFWLESSPLQWPRIARDVTQRQGTGLVGLGAGVRPAQHGAGGRLHRLVVGQVLRPVLAAGDRDPGGGERRQCSDQAGPRLDSARHHPAPFPTTTRRAPSRARPRRPS